jgi:hypothetical protein
MKYFKWFPFLTLLFSVGNTKSSPQTEIVKIQEILCYEDFTIMGYTTMSAVGHFNEMKKDKIPLKKITPGQTTAFERIILNAKKRRHYQTKLGIRHIFMLFKFEGVNDTNNVIINVGQESAHILDLSRFIEFQVKEPRDVEWIKKFFEEIKN